MIGSCPGCGGEGTKDVLTLEAMPVLCNQLWSDRDAALAAPAGDIALVRCETCGHVWNRSFDPERMVYTAGYENALHYSPVFQSFADDLAAQLTRAHDLTNRHVVEIGCGDGYMLNLMMDHGAATAIGFDPSMADRQSPYAEREGVEIVAAPFDRAQLDRDFDIVLCRHVLEHLTAPGDLLVAIREAIGARDVPVYFEVPNAEWMMRAVSIWDVIYEHVSYWSAASLTTAFSRAGFEPVSVRTGYADQFLMVEARPRTSEAATDIQSNPKDIAALAEEFRAVAGRKLAAWQTRLEDLSGTVVIWGAGSKGITFANAMGSAGRGFSAMVDLNPRKHGAFAPGAALEIVPPEALRDIRPDLVLVSNSLYRDEIARTLRDKGLAIDVEVIAG